MAEMLPKTRTPVDAAEQARLRSVIRTSEIMGGRWTPDARIAQPGDAAALADLLGHESIGPRIYTLPNPINDETMRDFIACHLEERARGDGILFLAFNAADEATAYFDVQLWAEWSAAKFGGAVSATRQGRGFGGVCGLAAMEWCFGTLGVSLVCETTALDNDRSIRLLSRLGMRQMGEVVSTRPDGSTRPSLYWEMSRTDWIGGRALQRAG
jgi:RimJ/RimL family protein N-acetyltransferase